MDQNETLVENAKFGCLKIFIVVVIIVFFGIGTSKVYYPIRLYTSGIIVSDQVDSVLRTSRGEAYQFISFRDKIEVAFFDEKVYIEEGDTVKLLINRNMGKGVLIETIEDGKPGYEIEPSFINILNNFDSSEDEAGMMTYLIVVCAAMLFVLLAALIKTVEKIKEDITASKEKLKNEDDFIFKYIRSYFVPLTYFIYAYGFLLILFQGIFLIERTSYLTVGILTFFGCAAVLYTPYIFFRIKGYFRNLQNKSFKVIIQIITTLIALKGTFGLIVFFSKYHLSEIQNLGDLIEKLFKELIKV